MGSQEILEIIRMYIEVYNEDDILLDIITDIENGFTKDDILDHYKLR